MRANSVRTRLKRASEEIQHACEAAPESSAERYLVAVAEQLHHHAEGTPRDPEAPVHPERGALDSIQRRVTEAMDGIEDDAAIEHLERAREELLLVIATLEDRWQKQQDFPSDLE